MAKQEKILGIVPKNVANILLGGLIVAFVLAWILSTFMENLNDPSAVYWLYIVELLALALIVGAAVGIMSGKADKSTLWIAAGLAVFAVIMAQSLKGNNAYPFDAAIIQSFGSGVFDTSVSVGNVILGILGAAGAACMAKK
jgi:FtsH-binding integral membrane protein